MYENINFLDLNEDEIKLVLSWRNSPSIKKWMHTKKDISLETHLNFIKSLKNNSKKDYFLVKKEDEYLGVIDLNNEFLGIYANPNKKRVGDILLNEIIKFAFERKRIEYLKAEVYKINSSAIKLYSRFGFETKQDDGIMLTMELNCENRKF
ncbi:MAG TPA: UDP-4-amino-4,6-dideoxy-N-acetyl-beta-L-altrosamine N-acetyltransferase [Sulfurospirillum arcachonense]|nr:UDP-4-amino-4,6-dideoxy-N-acetyl-beta-L-altrosamine N-acetyltransferase [Sulfurospirillum arcachonense]